MPTRRLLSVGLALVVTILAGRAASTEELKFLPRLSLPLAQQLSQNPQAMQLLLARLPAVPKGPPAPPPDGGPWQTLANPFPPGSGASNPLLLTDGTVIVHNACATDWWKLSPDSNGSYVNGTWSQIASLPENYGPLYFASAVLPDGRVVVEGGEYNFCGFAWTNKGAIYDPIEDSWTVVAPPSGWSSIGDAQSAVLDNGKFMLANCCTTQQAILDADSLTWTETGAGKFDINDEEGWTKLGDGTLLTVNAYVDTGTCGTGSQRYSPTDTSGVGEWADAGSTVVQLADCNGPNQSFELGPAALRPFGAAGVLGKEGAAIAFGGTTGDGPSHTAIYQASSDTWMAGPDIPAVDGNNLTIADWPAVTLPNGNVLFAASPNWAAYTTPTHFFEFDGVGFVAVPDTTDAAFTSSYFWNFLMLPSGQVLATNRSCPVRWCRSCG